MEDLSHKSIVSNLASFGKEHFRKMFINFTFLTMRVPLFQWNMDFHHWNHLYMGNIWGWNFNFFVEMDHEATVMNCSFLPTHSIVIPSRGIYPLADLTGVGWNMDWTIFGTIFLDHFLDKKMFQKIVQPYFTLCPGFIFSFVSIWRTIMTRWMSKVSHRNLLREVSKEIRFPFSLMLVWVFTGR